jgi:hypothetical protein
VGYLHNSPDHVDAPDVPDTPDPHRLLNGHRVASPAGYTPGDPVPGDVLVYFADDPRKLYQLRQWLPVLQRLHVLHPVLIVTRNPASYAELTRMTTLPHVLAPTFADLMGLYECGDHKVAIYVNNSVHNFHSLVARHMSHLHVNHGESDKICMVSNQVKAYDRVFVAGEAAVRRHRAALIEFDEDKLVRVGRPQLDLRPEPVLPPTDRRTILYAPTWEGENASNNYTSVDIHGPAMVAAALAVPHTRVVYKPHPRVASSPTPGIANAHRRIVELLAAAAAENPTAGHRYETSPDILAVFPGCDLMITDVSSVGLDFLYLRGDKPLFIVDRYDDLERLHADAPISRSADVVNTTTINWLTDTLAARLAVDSHRAVRGGIRRLYFGDLAPGESTERFLFAVGAAIRTRSRLLNARVEMSSAEIAEMSEMSAIEPEGRFA